MYGHKKLNDPACAKRRTDYINTVANCPVLWQAEFHSETALSTMDAEVIALAHSCRELLPIIDMVTSLDDVAGLSNNLPTTCISIHKDNTEALILLEILPPQYSP